MTSRPNPDREAKLAKPVSRPRQTNAPRPNAMPQKASRPKTPQQKPRQPKPQSAVPARVKASAAKTSVALASTKTGTLLTLLAAPDGASARDLSAALGWQEHTVRAALSGLRKAGCAIDLVKAADGLGSRYRLGAASTLAPTPAPIQAATLAPAAPPASSSATSLS